jgi:hypothetical protein
MYKTVFCALAVALLFSGCVTYQSPAMRTGQTEDQLIQLENQRRMAGRIETLEMEINRISSELDALRRTVDSRYTALEQKTQQDKREMIAQLSSQMEKLIKQSAPAPSASSYSGGRAGATGYEHIVQPGETLSAIAKAYNVTAKAVIEANKIKNPNRLSVGQKLFIPE